MIKVKITFPLEQDDDGYPPFTSESVWATATDRDSEYLIDSIPFFATQATLGDLVKAKKTEGEGRLFQRLIKRSGSSLVRVVIREPRYARSIRSRLIKLGCTTESFKERSILSVDIPASTNYAPVKAYLDKLEQDDIAGYEEPILRHEA